MMNNDKNPSRRNFIKQSSLGLGAGMVSISNPFTTFQEGKEQVKMPREIRVASIDLNGLRDDSWESRRSAILNRMEGIKGIRPDLICLTELFNTMWVKDQKPLSEIAEDEKIPGPATSVIAAFAKRNNCYVVCPLITKKEGHFYNSSLLINRKGGIAGVYHKMHPVKSEILPDRDFIGRGVTPGALDQPIIETDFGKVGMQICYDANWSEGWDDLKKKGADIVLFPSAYPGGRMLNYYALRNNYYVISSTGEDARIIDISGNDLDITSEFVRYAWATINLDKVNTPTWPTNDHLPALFKKYGNRLGVKVWGNTDVITIESRDPALNVLNVLKEFGIVSYPELLKNDTAIQNKYRPAIAINK